MGEHGGRYVGYDTGGWINEPLVRLGRSEQRYRFGESEPEYVSPGRNAAPGGHTTEIHNHFHASMDDTLARKIVTEQAWKSRPHGGF